jgi:DNA polymerase-1
VIALDFETALIEPGIQAPPPVCLGLFDGARFDLVSADEALPFLEVALADKIVGANVAFDLCVALETWPHLWPAVFAAYDRNAVFDVMVRQKLIDIALGEYRRHGGYDLATLAKRLCDRTLSKDENVRLTFWALRWRLIENWPIAHKRYIEADVTSTFAIFQAQEKALKELDREIVLDDQHRQGRADFALKLVSAWGLRTDAVGIETLRRSCKARQAEIRPGLMAAGLIKPTKESFTRCVRAAQARMKEVAAATLKYTKKGLELDSKDTKYIAVDEEACRDSGDDLLDQYSEYTQLGSLLSGHLKAMEEGTRLPIHSHFEVLLDTGRTSSSSPNVQNVRRLPGVRECFVPRDGWVYIGCDYSGAELHTLAQCCVNLFDASALADALNAGVDPHTAFGAKLAGVPYDVLKEQIAAGDKEAKAWRQRAKAFNFGAPGGMGPVGLQRYAKKAYGVILSMEDAQRFHEEWRQQWPEVAYQYLGWIKDITSAGGFATISHFKSNRWRGGVSFCKAANSFFQGMAADGMKRALFEVTRACYLPGSVLYGCRVVNEIHDELLLEAPADIASDAAILLTDIMEAGFNYYTPDVPVEAEPVLMDRWSKDAAQIIENGKLKVWRYAA